MCVQPPPPRSHRGAADAPLGQAPQVGTAFLSHRETLEHVQRGGSLARMNDGEQQLLSLDFSGPLAKPADLALRFQFAVQARCPGLCIGVVSPEPGARVELRTVGPTHEAWWQERGLPITKLNFHTGVLPPNRTYCFGMATYRPKVGPGAQDLAEFAAAWDLVFKDKNVLFIAPADWRMEPTAALEVFLQRCGGCKPISSFLYGEGELVPPFRLARRLSVLNPAVLPFQVVVGEEWPRYLAGVREAASEAEADVAAVAWGPFGDVLVAELACLGLPAVDVGNLLDILNRREKSVDPDGLSPDSSVSI